MVAILRLAITVCRRSRGLSIRSVPVAVDLSGMLKVANEEGLSIVGGVSTEERESLNKGLERETGHLA